MSQDAKFWLMSNWWFDEFFWSMPPDWNLVVKMIQRLNTVWQKLQCFCFQAILRLYFLVIFLWLKTTLIFQNSKISVICTYWLPALMKFSDKFNYFIDLSIKLYRPLQRVMTHTHNIDLSDPSSFWIVFWRNLNIGLSVLWRIRIIFSMRHTFGWV